MREPHAEAKVVSGPTCDEGEPPAEATVVSGPTCDEGHALQLHQGGSPYKDSHGVNAFSCNLCKRNVESPEVDRGFMRCASCSYDACHNCIPVCDNGHLLKEAQGNPYEISHGASGFSCNHCKRTVIAPEIDEGFFRCATCQFDACRSCIPTCSSGHLLKVFFGSPYLHTHGSSAISCDICKSYVDGPELANGFLRCASCNYDVCRSCAPITIPDRIQSKQRKDALSQIHVDYIANLEEFNTLVADTSSKPMIVDFTATWCPPC